MDAHQPRSQSGRAAREIEAHHSAILEAALDCIITIDHEGLVREFNPAAERTFGYRRSEVIGRTLAELIVPPALRAAHRDGLARYLSTAEAHILDRRIEMEAMRRDGTIFPVEIAVTRLELSGKPAFTAYLRDISERRDSERQLLAAEERYRNLVESLPTVVYEADFGADGAWRYVSPQIEGLLGFPPEDWLADPTLWFTQIHFDDRELALIQEHALRSKPPGQPVVSEYRMLTQTGRIVWIRDEAVVVPVDSGTPTQMRGVIVDITERKHLEAKLSRHAFYDNLTGLPNRALFMERLERAIAHRLRQSQGMIAVLFLDLDDFKVVNDTLGHAAGDSLLTTVANRLASTARPIDTPARFGGDEFTVLLEALEGPEDALQVAARLAERLAEPMEVGGRDLIVSVSIGIGITSDGLTSAEDLVSQADIAMYRAKENGKSRAQLYDIAMSKEAWRRLELERELRRAIEMGELCVHYQPVVNLHSGAIEQLEALVRWDHPERGLLQPDEFVPFAETTGLITRLDRFVLRQACSQLATWQSRYPAANELSVAVNLSPREFRAPGIVDEVSRVLHASGLDPSRLKLEITESLAMLDGGMMPLLIRGLNDLGVRVIIDDFGVGYSGLDYVKRLDVDGLKIDRSFVAGLGRRREDTAIVTAAAAFAKALDLSVVAEGIETVDQLERLRRLGCQSGQGFLISPPLTSEEIEAMLKSNRIDLSELVASADRLEHRLTSAA
jgi:diguanylate cyclase (GGDEF)-like protein/PAS domain S-box-containing protein